LDLSATIAGINTLPVADRSDWCRLSGTLFRKPNVFQIWPPNGKPNSTGDWKNHGRARKLL